MATTWVCPIDGALPADAGSAASGSWTPDQTKGANSVATLSASGNWVASTGSQVNLNGAAALGDFNGLPPHCPICGCACVTYAAATVTTLTGVASGSQHPADVNATYGARTDALSAQFGGTAYSPAAGYPVTYSHAYTAGQGSTHTVARGTASVSAETLNGTQGP